MSDQGGQKLPTTAQSAGLPLLEATPYSQAVSTSKT